MATTTAAQQAHYARGYRQAMEDVAAIIEAGGTRADVAAWVSDNVGRNVATVCATCLAYAYECADENIRDAGNPDATHDQITREAVSYVQTSMVTPCARCEVSA